MREPKDFEWNKEQVWTNIENKLNQRRRLLFFWIILSMAGVFTTIIFLYTFERNNNVEKGKDELKAQTLTEVIQIEDCDNLLEINNSTPDNTKLKIYPKTTQQYSSIGKKTAQQGDNYINSNNNNNASQTGNINLNGSDRSYASDLNNWDNSIENPSQEKTNLVTDFHNPLDLLPVTHISPWMELTDTEPLLQPTSFRTAIKAEHLKRSQIILESGVGIFGSQYRGNESYIQQRKNSEKNLLLAQFSLLYSFKLNKNWGLETGLRSEILTQLYQYETVQTITTEIWSPGAVYYILPDGGTFTEPGLTNQTEVTKRNIRKYNRTTRIQVPILIKYLIPIKKQDLYFQTGLRANVFNQISGVLLNTSNMHSFEKSQLNEIHNHPSFSLGFIFQAGMDIPMSQATGMRIGFEFQKDQIFEKQPSYGIRYHSLGINAGYYYTW